MNHHVKKNGTIIVVIAVISSVFFLCMAVLIMTRVSDHDHQEDYLRLLVFANMIVIILAGGIALYKTGGIILTKNVDKVVFKTPMDAKRRCMSGIAMGFWFLNFTLLGICHLWVSDPSPFTKIVSILMIPAPILFFIITHRWNKKLEKQVEKQLISGQGNAEVSTSDKCTGA
ncbi:MAG: hypothetical protein FWF10_01310 [Clostridiales bacterium]|nr:hypothetical protein [Clostridiales bacterium]